MHYLSDLETSIIMKRGIPETKYLEEMLPSNEIEDILAGRDIDDDIVDILLRSKNEIPGILISARAKSRNLMSLYVKMSKIPRFSEGFTVERFQGLLLVRRIISRRAVELSKK